MKDSSKQKTKAREGFMMYKSFYAPIKGLSNEELGQLFRMIMEYQIDQDTLFEHQVSSGVNMAFEFFKNQFRLDDKKYEKSIVQRNRENGKKGGRPKKEGNPKNPVGLEKPKKPDKDKEKEKEKVKDNEKDLQTSFGEFWDLYPVKTGKQKCLTKYSKVYKKHDAIISGLKKYIAFINYLTEQQRQNPKVFVPHYKNPETWLNQQCWEDEYTAEFQKEIKRLEEKEAARLFELEQKRRKDADNIYSLFRTGFMNKRFGEGGWRLYKAFNKREPDGKKELYEDQELMSEINDKFKELHPKEYAILNHGNETAKT